MQSASPDSRKIAGIDQLRGLAALAVVVCHIAGHFYGVDRYSPGPARLLGWLGQWGVALFFVISGFCIRLPLARARAIDPEARLDVKDYLLHRLLRIAPPYWLALGLSVAAGSLATTELMDGAHGAGDIAVHALLLHTLWPSTFNSINGVFWTIGIEAHFYLAYLLLANRPVRPATVLALLALGLGVYGAVSALLPPADPWREVGQELFVTTFWQWALGALLADLWRARRPCWPARLLWPARWGAVAASLMLGLFDPTLAGLHLAWWALPFAAAAVVALFVVCAEHPSRPNAISAALGWLGAISYSLYLLHPAVLSVAAWAIGRGLLPAGAGPAAELAGSLAAAWICYRLVERPLLAWRRRLKPVVDAPHAVAPATP